MPALEEMRPVAQLAEAATHGQRIKYLGGCRCIDCRKANSLYSYEREVAVREGRGNPIVDASLARSHILALGQKGVGYKTVAEAAQVSMSIVAGIRSGRRHRARRQSVQRILAVDESVKADHALIPAKKTWALIGRLLDEGYTKRFLAGRLCGGKALQLGKRQVTVRNAAKVQRLYRHLMS